jgi:hypothetical protein
MANARIYGVRMNTTHVSEICVLRIICNSALRNVVALRNFVITPTDLTFTECVLKFQSNSL